MNLLHLLVNQEQVKTTLVDVILGLLMPTNGDIQVDGVSIYKNLRAWQNMIGYIPQTIFLIDDTVERNIAFGVNDELIDPKRLQKAIEGSSIGGTNFATPKWNKNFCW